MKQTSFTRFINKEKRELLKALSKSIFWFFAGVFLGLFLLISLVYISFEKKYEDKIYPGIMVNRINLGGQKESDAISYFKEKNQKIADTKIFFKKDDIESEASAADLGLGYNSILLSHQAFELGRSQDFISNISIIIQAYIGGLNLPASYSYSSDKLDFLLTPFKERYSQDPQDALFSFENGKVIAFRPSLDGQSLDNKAIQKKIIDTIPQLLFSNNTGSVTIPVEIKILKPNTTTEDANNLGIKELITSGTSLFQHSIESRIYNVTLAAARLNGLLVKPDEIFSFDQALGDVSAFTGYKQAYVIQNGKTVLGDGGGVCQVSTTLFRAILNAGLPIVERHAHAYRVGYYEEDSPPGLDATVYVPTVDLKFKNDTGHYILIQTIIDPADLRLTFFLYGTKDDRQVTLTQPVVTNVIPAPADSYQDDPTLPKGAVKQIDFSANGATVTFGRTVTRRGITLISETYTSIYQPWQAIFLRGTKE